MMNNKPEIQFKGKSLELIAKEVTKDNPVRGIEVRLMPDPYTAKDVPQIMCQCGEFIQSKFCKFVTEKQIPVEGYPHRIQRKKIVFLRCDTCGYSIPFDEFAKMAEKFAKDNKIGQNK